MTQLERINAPMGARLHRIEEDLGGPITLVIPARSARTAKATNVRIGRKDRRLAVVRDGLARGLKHREIVAELERLDLKTTERYVWALMSQVKRSDISRS
jgi:hypothetical protein